MANKIPMTTPLVEMDGDEMTRIIWKMIKDILLTPYIDLKTEYYAALDCTPRRDQRPGDRGQRQRYQEIRCGRQVRHHHAECCPCGGV